MQESTRQKLFQLYTDKINYLNQRLVNINIDIDFLKQKKHDINIRMEEIRENLNNYSEMSCFVFREMPDSDQKTEMLKDIDIHLIPLQEKMSQLSEEERVIITRDAANKTAWSYTNSDLIIYNRMIECLNKLDS